MMITGIAGRTPRHRLKLHPGHHAADSSIGTRAQSLPTGPCTRNADGLGGEVRWDGENAEIISLLGVGQVDVKVAPAPKQGDMR